MRPRDPADWMWAQACDLIAQAERMQRQFFRLAPAERAQPAWEPPVDVYEGERDVVVVVALPGVPAERIDVAIEGGEIVVRAERRLDFAGGHRAVRRLEIPHGHFERRIGLQDARFETAARESVDGCLVVRLRKLA